jgi:hypothetical protein
MIVLTLFLITLFVLYYCWISNLEPVSVQGNTLRQWQVIGDYENRDSAARAMSRMHDKLIVLGAYLQEKYHISETDDEIAREGDRHISSGEARQLAYYYLRDYDPDVIYETDNRYTNDTSYNLSKGEAIYMCMRKKDNPTELESDNLLMFVILHEISHTILKDDWGHSAKFWQIFKWLLTQAIEANVYVYEDFAKNPQNFCGLNITYTPLDDASLPIIV